MVELIGSFSYLKPANVLVVGDFMFDVYTGGNVERISPEAPVPILHVKQINYLPGGAGNVALNLKALGAQVFCIGRIGFDLEGRKLKKLLEKEQIDHVELFQQKKFITPLKNRLIAEGQQLIRFDNEIKTLIDKETEKKALQSIEKFLNQVDAVAVSDYGKGFLSKELLCFLILETKKRGIPILIDPKGEDFTRYRGATLIKPNYKEARIAAHLTNSASIDDIGQKLMKETEVDYLVITRSSRGMTLFEKNQKRSDFPAKSREVNDVTGAGDTTLAMLTMGSASDLKLSHRLHLSNVAAGIAIEKVGCFRVSLSDIAKRLITTDVKNKVFDEHHLFALEQMLKNQKILLLGIHPKEALNASLFLKIQKLSMKNKNINLGIYLIHHQVDPNFVSLLSSLHEVDFIILNAKNLSSLCERVHPSEVYLIEGRSLKKMSHHDRLFQFH